MPRAEHQLYLRGAGQPAGAVLDPNGFKVDGDSVSDQWPAVCFMGTDHLVSGK